MGKKNGRVVWDNWEDWFFVVVFAAQHGVVEMFYKHMSIQSLTQLLSYCYLHDSLCTLTIGPRRNQLVFSWLTSNTFFCSNSSYSWSVAYVLFSVLLMLTWFWRFKCLAMLLNHHVTWIVFNLIRFQFPYTMEGVM